jgi:hypothetical protein
LLHIYENTSSTSTSAGLTVENDGAGDAIVQFLLTGTKRWVIGIDNSDSDKFKIADSADLNTDARFVIDSSGNVGIGTTTPSEKLHVAGNIISASSASAGKLQFGTDTTAISLYRDNGSDLVLHQGFASGNALYLGSLGSVFVNLDTNNNDTNKIFAVTTNALKGGTELFRVQENGNVGIGTTTPGYKLDTSTNTVNFGNVRTTGGIAGFYLQDRTSTGDGWQWYSTGGILRLYDNTATAGDRFYVTKNGTNAEFGINGSSSADRTLTITSTISTNRPAIKIVNPNTDTITGSGGRSFHGWLPIDIGGTTRYIQLYV